MRGKKPLSEKQVVALRKLMEGNELHELLLNLGVDLMLRASDLLNLKVSDVLNESGTVKKEVRVKMKKTKKTTLNLPLSKNSIAVIKKYLPERKREDFIFQSTHYHYTRKPLSIYQYSRIVKNWLRDLGVECFRVLHSFNKKEKSYFNLVFLILFARLFNSLSSA